MCQGKLTERAVTVTFAGDPAAELASDAHQLFLEQEPKEKRRLLAFMVSSARWKKGGFEPRPQSRRKRLLSGGIVVRRPEPGGHHHQRGSK